MLAIGQLRHQSATARTLATHAADAVAAHQCHERDSDVIFTSHVKLECGPMPNVMATLPNIDGALCSMPQSLADAHN